MWVCPDVLLLYTIWVNSDDDEDKTEGKNKRRTGGTEGGGRERSDGRTDGRTGRVEPSRVELIHLIDFERGTISVVRGL